MTRSMNKPTHGPSVTQRQSFPRMRLFSEHPGAKGPGRFASRLRPTLALALAAAILAPRPVDAQEPAPLPERRLQIGQGTVDITPATGLTMGGFHFTPDNPRRIEGVRQRASATVLVIQLRESTAAMISMDLLNVSRDFVQRTRDLIQEATGIAGSSVQICATHTHSMPTVAFNRQWGDQHPEYLQEVQRAVVGATLAAVTDLAPARLFVGSAVAENANANRTVAEWRNEDQFDAASTDADRWLDRRVRVLHFERTFPKRNVLWYHFSAHPTCYHDRQCGPDWPGDVARIVQRSDGVTPVFLQGHIGDVSPAGGGLGNAEITATNVAGAIARAVRSAKQVSVETMLVKSRNVALPLDLNEFAAQMKQFEENPTPKGSFDEDWYSNFAVTYDQSKTELNVEVAALRLGDIALVFHPSELYSYYGLAIDRGAPFKQTLVVGYADGYVGYLPDPLAFERREYAAVTVPRILNFPPFSPTAARRLADDAIALLNEMR